MTGTSRSSERIRQKPENRWPALSFSSVLVYPFACPVRILFRALSAVRRIKFICFFDNEEWFPVNHSSDFSGIVHSRDGIIFCKNHVDDGNARLILYENPAAKQPSDSRAD